MKYYFQCISMHIRVSLQHRLSLFFMTLGQFLTTLTSYVTIFLLMRSDRVVAGFSRDEVLVCGTVIMVSFAIAECFARGFDTFSILLGNGGFDRMLVRPRNIIVQILGSTVEFSRVGRLVISLVILWVSLQNVTIRSYWLLILMILSGVVLFSCLFIIYGALCFFSTESLEFMNILTDGAREFGKVPFSYYGKQVLSFLTYVVPLACVQYYPMLYLLGKRNEPRLALAPLLSMLFVIPTGIIWQFGRRKYRSTGS